MVNRESCRKPMTHRRTEEMDERRSLIRKINILLELLDTSRLRMLLSVIRRYTEK